MLDARSEAPENQRDDQYGEGRACTKTQIGGSGDRRAGREHPRPADQLRQLGCRDLQTRHRACIKRAQRAYSGVAQRKLRLQDREQQIERVGQAVMQRVGAAGDPEHAHSVGIGTICTAGRRREFANCHDAMPSRRELLRAPEILPRWMDEFEPCDALMTNDLF